jgi:phosphoketolase
MGGPVPESVSDQQLRLMDAYWRAANYLSVGQMYQWAFGCANRLSVDHSPTAKILKPTTLREPPSPINGPVTWP